MIQLAGPIKRQCAIHPTIGLRSGTSHKHDIHSRGSEVKAWDSLRVPHGPTDTHPPPPPLTERDGSVEKLLYPEMGDSQRSLHERFC